MYPRRASVEAVRGLDVSLLPARRDAMRAAAATGATTATAPHRAMTLDALVTVAFTPVYRVGAPLRTVQDRRAALRGFVLSSFIARDLIEASLDAGFLRAFDVEVYDHAAGQDQLVYATGGVSRARGRAGDFLVLREPLAFAGRRWEVFYYAKPGGPADGATRAAAPVYLSGVLGSVVLAFSTWYLRRRLRRRYTHDALAEHLHRAFEHHPSAVYYLDTQRRVVNANDKALADFGVAREELIGASSEAFLAPEQRDLARRQWHEAASGGRAASYDTVVVARDGHRFDARIVLVPMLSEGHVAGVLGIAENITERKQQEAEVRASRHMLQSIIDHLPHFVFWKDTSLRYLGCNRPFAQYHGFERVDDIVGRTDQDLLSSHGRIDGEHLERYRDDDLTVIRTAQPAANIELRIQLADGRDFWGRTHKLPLLDEAGQVTGLLGVSEDITERKQLELRLEQLAYYDSLTGLPNREFFLVQLDQALRRAERNAALLAVTYFDIDRFKSINDTWGHDVGDMVIAAFAGRVRAAVRDVDIIGRMGGDEFVMVSEGLGSAADIEIVTGRMIEAVRQPLSIGGITLGISTSVGVAFHRPGMAADALLRQADQAMYAAKQAGRDRVEFAL